uniref:Uncharacterized protein n=1 Tax=Magallana gigas TaxID=29159 RepID=K1PCU2_MAGGI
MEDKTFSADRSHPPCALCRIQEKCPHNLEQSFNPPIPDQELCKLSAHLLSQCGDVFPVKKEETTPPAIKPEIQCA